MGAVKEDTQRVELTEEDAGVGGDDLCGAP